VSRIYPTLTGKKAHRFKSPEVTTGQPRQNWYRELLYQINKNNMNKKKTKGKIEKPLLKKDSELMTKRNAKYLDKDSLTRYEIDGNKWWIGNAETFKRKLLKKATITEKILTKFLKSKKVKVDPQRVIYIDYNCIINKFYIADIYLPELNLIVEIDGGYHETAEQKEKDYNRDMDLMSVGYKIFRCTTSDVLKSPEVVYQSIMENYKKHII